MKTTYCRQIVGFLIFALLAPPSAVFAQSTDSTTTADGTQSAAAVTVSDPVLDAPSGTMDTAAPDSEELTKTPKISNGQLKKDTTTGMDETDSSLMTMSLSGTTEPVSVEHAAQFGYDEVKATVDVQSGALTQRIPLEVPPGRNGLEPQVSLMYNSQNTENGIVGYGWSVPIPYITRVNKDGTEDLYSASTTPQFSSSIDGELIMGTTTSTQYYPRTLTEQSFEYYFEDNVWTVYDRNGTRYSFGTTTASWLYDEATTSPKIYRWMLEEVRDTSDNYIEFSYAREDGQLYPTTIMYTGHGSTDGPFTVTFTREARLDPMVSYATGFKVETKKRISQIETAVDGQWVRRYALSYTTGNNGYRSLLSSVQQTGRDASGTTESLDPFVFT